MVRSCRFGPPTPTYLHKRKSPGSTFALRAPSFPQQSPGAAHPPPDYLDRTTGRELYERMLGVAVAATRRPTSRAVRYRSSRRTSSRFARR